MIRQFKLLAKIRIFRGKRRQYARLSRLGELLGPSCPSADLGHFHRGPAPKDDNRWQTPRSSALSLHFHNAWRGRKDLWARIARQICQVAELATPHQSCPEASRSAGIHAVKPYKSCTHTLPLHASSHDQGKPKACRRPARHKSRCPGDSPLPSGNASAGQVGHCKPLQARKGFPYRNRVPAAHSKIPRLFWGRSRLHRRETTLRSRAPFDHPPELRLGLAWAATSF